MVALNSDFAASKPDTDTKNRVGRFFSLAAESIEEDRRSSRGDTRKKRDYCYDIASVDTAFEYGPFGELIRATGEKKDAFNFRFSTKYEDTETRLLYYGYRYYNAEAGRWLNRDPLGEIGGANVYVIVKNNVINFYDVLGLYPGEFIIDYWHESIMTPTSGTVGAKIVSFIEGAGEGVIQFPGDVKTGFVNTGEGLGETAAHIVNFIQYDHVKEEFFNNLSLFYECLEDPCCRQKLKEELGENVVFALENYRDHPGQAVGELIAAIGSGAGFAKVIQKIKGFKAKKPVKPGGFDDKPPGWNEDWEWLPSERLRKKARDRGEPGWRWYDKNGGEWRRHAADKNHPEAHWDYSPNRSWNDEWFNVDDNGNLILPGFSGF